MPEGKITLSIRLHDAAEKKDNLLSAKWVVTTIERADLTLPDDQFIEKYVRPAVAGLSAFRQAKGVIQ